MKPPKKIINKSKKYLNQIDVHTSIYVLVDIWNRDLLPFRALALVYRTLLVISMIFSN